MKRDKLEKYLGKIVEITLYDGDIVKGELHKTGDIPHNYYFLINPQSCLFRCSHVIKIKINLN